MMAPIKSQIIKPTDKKGKNSFIGEPKILPKTSPMQDIVTLILIVIQNGPINERRYLFLISFMLRIFIRFNQLRITDLYEPLTTDYISPAENFALSIPVKHFAP